jgi:hypothetical protein
MSDSHNHPGKPYVFPRAANYLLPALLLLGIGAGPYLIVALALGGSPTTTDVGYQPTQPVEFSHALHAGKLGLDCRYCHSTVDKAAFAAIPPTQTCLNCHNSIKTDSPKLIKVRESNLTGRPLEWVKVHNLPDYAYFNHSAHVTKGVSCVSCHGRIDQMETVYQAKTLSMGFCLDCHRAPEEHLRPLDKVTDLGWTPPNGDQISQGLELKAKLGIRGAAYMTSCSTCHR